MTEDQRIDLFIKWGLYEPKRQMEMVDEYLSISDGNCSRESFLNFLKDKMEIEGYWKEAGLM